MDGRREAAGAGLAAGAFIEGLIGRQFKLVLRLGEQLVPALVGLQRREQEGGELVLPVLRKLRKSGKDVFQAFGHV